LFVLGETGTEFPNEEGFFAAGFDVEREPGDGHRQQSADFAEGNGGSEKRE